MRYKSNQKSFNPMNDGDSRTRTYLRCNLFPAEIDGRSHNSRFRFYSQLGQSRCHQLRWRIGSGGDKAPGNPWCSEQATERVRNESGARNHKNNQGRQMTQQQTDTLTYVKATTGARKTPRARRENFILFPK
jgi:hypothetical protein